MLFRRKKSNVEIRIGKKLQLEKIKSEVIRGGEIIFVFISEKKLPYINGYRSPVLVNEMQNLPPPLISDHIGFLFQKVAQCF